MAETGVARLLDWDVIGWIVAALLGAWGAMIGIGQFAVSTWLLIASGVLIIIPSVRCAWKKGSYLHWLAPLIAIGLVVFVEFVANTWMEAYQQKPSKPRVKSIKSQDSNLLWTG